jgi:hypothetical protein
MASSYDKYIFFRFFKRCLYFLCCGLPFFLIELIFLLMNFSVLLGKLTVIHFQTFFWFVVDFSYRSDGHTVFLKPN